MNLNASSHAQLNTFIVTTLYRTVCYVVITCYAADRSDKCPGCYLWNMWQI